MRVCMLLLLTLIAQVIHYPVEAKVHTVFEFSWLDRSEKGVKAATRCSFFVGSRMWPL